MDVLQQKGLKGLSWTGPDLSINRFQEQQTIDRLTLMVESSFGSIVTVVSMSIGLTSGQIRRRNYQEIIINEKLWGSRRDRVR